jgi:hypothetical protein
VTVTTTAATAAGATSRDWLGERRSNETHASTTDPDARLYKKAPGQVNRLCFVATALEENRNGLNVDGRLTRASGVSEGGRPRRRAHPARRHAGRRLSSAPLTPSASPPRSAGTGRSRTACFGSSTSPSTRSAPATAATTGRRTSPSSAASPSTPQPRPPMDVRQKKAEAVRMVRRLRAVHHRPNAIALLPGYSPIDTFVLSRNLRGCG